MIPLILSGSVGYDEDNDPEDVAQTGAALATLGHFDALEAVRSGKFDDGLDGAIHNYQSDNDLDPDGILLPDGPTQKSLNDALKDHRPGPSLLPIDGGEAANGPSPRGLAPRIRAGENVWRGAPSQMPGASADNSIPSDPLTISNRAARNMAAAQNVSGLLDVLGQTIESPQQGALEQRLKTGGYRYVPDPMGRIDEGDWVNERGDRIGAVEARSVTRLPAGQLPERAQLGRAVDARDDDAHGVTVVAARASAPARRIASTFENLGYDLDTATAYVKRGEGNVRVAVPAGVSETTMPAGVISRINAGIREAVIANALLGRSTGAEEIASVTKDIADNPMHGPKTGQGRVKDMLLEAALNAATPDQRLHARGLLAVYELEEREAKAAGRPDPRAGADAAIAAFAAGLSGDVSWSVYDPAEGDEDEEDGRDFEPAADDPDNPRRPRGMHNERTREAAREGKRRHDELKERVEKKKDRGWNKDGYKVNGRWIFPDATTRRGYLLELKPDTPPGRAAGEKQCAEYTRVTNRRCRSHLLSAISRTRTPVHAAAPGHLN